MILWLNYGTCNGISLPSCHYQIPLRSKRTWQLSYPSVGPSSSGSPLQVRGSKSGSESKSGKSSKSESPRSRSGNVSCITGIDKLAGLRAISEPQRSKLVGEILHQCGSSCAM